MGYFLAKDKCPNLEENKIRIVSETVYKAENKLKIKQDKLCKKITARIILGAILRLETQKLQEKDKHMTVQRVRYSAFQKILNKANKWKHLRKCLQYRGQSLVCLVTKNIYELTRKAQQSSRKNKQKKNKKVQFREEQTQKADP